MTSDTETLRKLVNDICDMAGGFIDPDDEIGFRLNLENILAALTPSPEAQEEPVAWRVEDRTHPGWFTYYDPEQNPPHGAEALVLATALDAANAKIEGLTFERDFFQSEVKLRNRIPATSDAMADMLRRAELYEAQSAQIATLQAEVERLLYVLGGVAGAIDTGRNKPLMIWRDQIKIAIDGRAEAAEARRGEAG